MTEVAGQVSTQFGIEFRIDGNPVGDGVTLHMVLNFPPQGIRNPNTGDTMHTANIAFPNLKIGAKRIAGRVRLSRLRMPWLSTPKDESLSGAQAWGSEPWFVLPRYSKFHHRWRI